MSQRAHPLLVACTMALLLATAGSAGAVTTRERNALEALYVSTDGANWINNDNWLGPPGTECTWLGVRCDVSGSQVLALGLTNNGLTGTLPPELGDLENLTSLSLRGNPLSGAIPSTLGALPHLGSLLLDSNQLSGSIPPQLGDLTSLRTLWLSNNQLTGTIPPGLGRLRELSGLLLSGNQLTGPIPPELGDLTELRSLGLGRNQLSGSIPAELGDAVQLRTLDLGENRLSGEIPPELGNLTALTFLNAFFNQLSGSIPPSLAALPDLGSVNLASNRLSGPIPPEFGDATDLGFLRLDGNFLSGSIPPELSQLTKLRFLNLARNQLSGVIPSGFGDLTDLLSLGLERNRLSGPVPPDLGALTQLFRLELAQNRLTGPVPPELGNLALLQRLTLSSNQLVGPLPATLLDLTALSEIRLRYNGLFTDDPALTTFLAAHSPTAWEPTQTVAPTEVEAEATGPESIRVSWRPITFTDFSGGYRVEIGTSPGGPYDPAVTTADKSSNEVLVSGLDPATSYHAVVRTVTFEHTANQNTVISAPSEEVAATTASANRPPVANAGPDQVLAADANCRALATLDASASFDPDGDPLNYHWMTPDGRTLKGVRPQIGLPLGIHAFDLQVEDGFGGVDTDGTVVTIVDRSAPAIDRPLPTPASLWPPNHRMVPVELSVPVADACDPQPVCRIVGVASNEPVDGAGDGATSPDWEIPGPLTVLLRAERSGRGGGRTYGVEVGCRDASGNSASATVEVSVRHDRGR